MLSQTMHTEGMGEMMPTVRCIACFFSISVGIQPHTEAVGKTDDDAYTVKCIAAHASESKYWVPNPPLYIQAESFLMTTQLRLDATATEQARGTWGEHAAAHGKTTRIKANSPLNRTP
jgi:hypothetical protein